MTISRLLFYYDGGNEFFHLITKTITAENEVREVDASLMTAFVEALKNFMAEVGDEGEYLEDFNSNIHSHMIIPLENKDGEKIFATAGYSKHHIENGVEMKIRSLYKRFFYDLKLAPGQRATDKGLENKVYLFLHDIPLKLYLQENLDEIERILNPVVDNDDNHTVAYALTASDNTILHFYGKSEKTIKEYISYCIQKKTPQGLVDFLRTDLETGKDVKELKGDETIAFATNTSINLKHEKDNKVLLYFFTKHHLMGNLVINKSFDLLNSSHNWKKSESLNQIINSFL